MGQKEASVVITTRQDRHSEWMAFACWYSVHKNLPGCRVGAVFPRANSNHQLAWMNRVGVSYINYGRDSSEAAAVAALGMGDALVIADYMMMVREPGEVAGPVEAMCAPATSELALPLVDYRVCGRFRLDKWREAEKGHPFGRASIAGTTVNEYRVFQLWRKMCPIFNFINPR